MFIKCGGIATAIIALSGAWNLGVSKFEQHRPWADRRMEIIVAGLQIDSLRAKEQQNRFQMFQLEDEKRRDGARFPKWKEDLLQRIRYEQQQIDREIKRLESFK